MYKNKLEIINGDVLSEVKDGIHYHFSEYNTNWYNTIFYEIFVKDGIKKIKLEFITIPGFVEDGVDAFIQYLEYEKFNNYFNREEYSECIISNSKSKYDDVIDEDFDYSLIEMPVSSFLKHGTQANFIKLTNNYRRRSAFSCEEAFYQNDYLLFNYGKGRTELGVLDISLETPEGKYFCNALEENYEISKDRSYSLGTRN